MKELLQHLNQLPQDADVRALYDGAARTEVGSIWLARAGYVVLADKIEPVYYTKDRPSDAPTEEQEPYWNLGKDPFWDELEGK